MSAPWHCDFRRDGEYLVCQRCGYRHRTDNPPERVASRCPNGERPAQPFVPGVAKPRSRYRVGTWTKRILGWLGIRPSGCRCKSRAAQMDAIGLAGCWAQRHTIVAWMAEEAQKRRMRYCAPMGYAVLVLAGLLAVARCRK